MATLKDEFIQSFARHTNAQTRYLNIFVDPLDLHSVHILYGNLSLGAATIPLAATPSKKPTTPATLVANPATPVTKPVTLATIAATPLLHLRLQLWR